MKCDRCNQPNTEFSEFTIEVDISELKHKVNINSSSWIKKVVIRYVNALLNTKLTKSINVCQTCQSIMFRKLDKNK